MPRGDKTCECPHCGQELAVPDRVAGKTVRCPKCKQPFKVPAPADNDVVELEVVELEPEELPRPRRRRRDDDDDDDLDEDDDAPPRLRRRRHDEDDDDIDERPRKKRRAKPARRRRAGPYNLRNLILGSIGLVWGLSVIGYGLTHFQNPAAGPQAAGACCGQIFGLLLFVTGAYYVGRELITGGTD